MKIIYLINTVIVINIFVRIVSPDVYAYDSVYDIFINDTKEYDKLEIVEKFSETPDHSTTNTMYVIKRIFESIFSELKLSLKYFLEIMVVCIISSLLK